MPWWVPLLIMFAVMLVARLLAGQVKQESARDETEREIRFSKLRYALPVPAVFGKCRVGGMYIEVGNFRIVEATEDYGKAGQRLYYTYRVDVGVAICLGPVDWLRWVEAGKSVATVNVDRTEGGIRDNYFQIPSNWLDGVYDGRFYWGTEEHTQEYIFQTLIGHGADTVSYRSICFAAMRCNLGESTIPLAFSWVVERRVDILTTKPNNIGEHGNAAQILWYMLRNSTYFLGMTEAQLNKASFEAASDILEAEGLGCSVTLERGTENISRYVKEILDWIDGVLVRENGILYLRLRRPGSPEITIGEGDIEGSSVKLKRPGWPAVKNMISLEWNDSGRKYERHVIHMMDPAVREASGHFVLEKFHYNITATSAMAKLVAARKLFSVSYPFAMVEFLTTRTDIYREQLVTLEHDTPKLSGRWRIINLKRLSGSEVSAVEAIEEPDRPMSTFVYQNTLSDEIEEDPDTAAIVWGRWEGLMREIMVNVVKDYDATPQFIGMRTDVRVGEAVTLERGILYYANCIGTVRTQLNWNGDWRDFDQTLEVNELYADGFDLASVSVYSWHGGAIPLLIITGATQEVIYVQNVTELSWGFQFNNLLRGREVTDPGQHNVGSYVYLLRSRNEFKVGDPPLWKGEHFYLDGSPIYLVAGKQWADSDNESTVDWYYQARRHIPLPVCNIEISGQGNDNRYLTGTDVTFKWRARTRKGGAGFNASDARAASEYELEHTNYEIWTYDSGMGLKGFYNLAAADGEEWTYTYAMRQADGLTSDFYISIRQTGQFASDGELFFAKAI